MSVENQNEIQEEKLEELEEKNESEQAIPDCSKAEEEAIQLKDQLLRLAADMENLRKRSAKQIEDANKFAINSFAKDLIDVLENLYLATNNVPAEALEEDTALIALFKGVEMTKNTLINVFDKYGLKRIFPEIGSIFDHNFHEAVAQVPNPEFADNAIINVMRAGYSLNDRLIKPAMVAVAKSENKIN